MVLFVDDEPHRVAKWRKALEQAFPTDYRFSPSADRALEVLNSTPAGELRLAIFDEVMPTPSGVEGPATEYGTRTGSYLAMKTRELHPSTPVILLTNVEDRKLFKDLEALGFTPRHKQACMPEDLLALARELMALRAPGLPHTPPA